MRESATSAVPEATTPAAAEKVWLDSAVRAFAESRSRDEVIAAMTASGLSPVDAARIADQADEALRKGAREQALKTIGTGAAWAAFGALVTAVTWTVAERSGVYLAGAVPIIFGLYTIARGAQAWSKG